MTDVRADVVIRGGQPGDLEYIVDSWARTLQVLDRAPGGAARCKAAVRAVLGALALSGPGARVLVACSPAAPELIRGYLVRDAAGVQVFGYVRRLYRGAGIYSRLKGTP